MPKIIELEIDSSSSFFVLTGSIDELLIKRRANMYLTDLLHAYVDDQHRIIIPYEEDAKEQTLNSILKLLEKFDFYANLSAGIKSALRDFLQEEENFKEFSKQAFEIRNNQIYEDKLYDFAHFTDVLSRLMTTRTLYPLQLLSAYHLAFSQNSCNFSVPGSGKTSIVLAAYCYLASLPKTDPKHVEKLVIIGPLSSFGPWELEYRECFGRQPDVKRLAGGATAEAKSNHFYSTCPSEITLLSYNSLPSILQDIQYFLRKYNCMVVLDEAHKIKNIEGGLYATSTLELARYSKSRVVLTGTPAPNGYEDLNNLFKFIWPTKDVIGFHPFQLKEMSDLPSDNRIDQLIENISPYFMRIKKSDLGLPEQVNHDPIIINMGAHQREIYNFIEDKYISYLISQNDNPTAGFHNAMAKARLIRLMQASTNPALLGKSLDEYFSDLGYPRDIFIDENEILRKIIDYPEVETPPKFIVAGNLVSEILATGKKVVIWAVFIDNLHAIQNYLLGLGINSKLLYGATPVEVDSNIREEETREKIISDFHRTSSDFNVIIANPFAVSESISLHKACQNAIYIERTFNAAHYIQSKDRIHRVGLKDKANYYYLLSDNNVDRTIHERLNEKERKMLEIIEENPIPLFSRILAGDSDDDDVIRLVKNYVQHHSHS
jgi:SNF2 family DNA or RNA helicase